MVLRGLAVVFPFLFISLALAGCFGGEPARPASVAPQGAVLVTKENDKETLANETFSMEAHVHDYWGGKQRLVVMDEERDAGTTWDAPYWAEVFLPADDAVVPQGTSSVEVTMEWTDGAQHYYTAPELWVRTAADNEAQLVGAIKSGDKLVVSTTLANADLPHQSISAWRFELRLHKSDLPSGMIVWTAHVKVHVEAVRGLELPVYPPHPDLWGGKRTLSILDDDQPMGVWIKPLSSCLAQCDFPYAHPPNGTIVPFDAKGVDFQIQKSADSATELGLRFHGADSRKWTEPTPISTDGGIVKYHVDLVPGMGDSPYATQSVWEFQTYMTGATKGTVKTGSYHVTASATR
jgi:hypothetical protein